MPGRPRLILGTHGKIRTDRLSDGRHKAITRFRDADGRTRQYARTATSPAKAERALKAALADRAGEVAGDEITPATTVGQVAGEFFADLERLAASGDVSPTTVRLYRGAWRNHIQPAIGELAIREMTVRRVDLFLRTLRERNGPATVHAVRKVLSGIVGLAVRYNALATNPVRQVGRIPGDGAKVVRALEPAEAVDIWEKLTSLAAGTLRDKDGAVLPACDPDLPDLVLWMLGTGDRLGNAIAVHWPWIDLEEGTAKLGPNVIRVKGEGLRLNQGTSKTREAEMDLPEQVLAMLLARQQRPLYRARGPVFPDSRGGLRDPSNTSAKALRPALRDIGYGHVTAHWFRRTVGSELDRAGLPVTEVAARLRHASVRTTQEHYLTKRARSTRTKAALEAMLSTEPERKVVGLRD